MPANVDYVDYFGLDRIVCVNDLFNPSPGLPCEVLDETAEQRVVRDAYGKRVRVWKAGSHPPAIVKPAFATRADWERIKPRLIPSPEKLDNPGADAEYRAAVEAEHFIAITPAEPVWFVIYLTQGYEHGLRLMARDPEWVADMVTHYTDYVLGMLALLLERGYRFDAIWFWSDLCYRNGMLFSPRAARRMALPCWQRIGAFARAHDLRYIFHCDGNVGPLIPLLLEAEVHALHPLEVRAGNDAREYKQRYGDRLCLIGNIDADVVATNDPDQIEQEVAAKVPELCAGGGYVYNIDHSVPPSVSLTSYRHLLDCVRRHGVGSRV